MKDNFSTHSDKYAQYRPTYPVELFEFIMTHVKHTKTAWDCGTGNGQVARQLANYFEQVYASDISAQQIEHAQKHSNIIYSVQPAEKTNYPDKSFDLIVVAQAIHWFNFEKFYTEVKRALKNDGVFVVLRYGNAYITAEIDAVVEKLYNGIVGPYWDKERKYIEESYQTIPFPFQEVETPQFVNTFSWTFEHFVGYLKTWSAVKHFIKQRGYDPLDDIYEELSYSWGNVATREVNYPLLLRVGTIT